MERKIGKIKNGVLTKLKRKIILLVFPLFFAFNVFSQENSESLDSKSLDSKSSSSNSESLNLESENSEVSNSSDSNSKSLDSESLDSESLDLESESTFDEVVIPSAKRPKSPDSKKVKDLDNTDGEAREKNPEILKFGLEEDISELLDKMTRDKDVRFSGEVYDLFQETKSNVLREKILRYFSAIEDPCLEDFAVEILDDPYDEKKSVVDACFSYVQSVKTKEAIPAAKKLLESDDESYFQNSIETLGKVGGASEAVYLSKYIDNEDLSLAQRQSLVRALGSLHAAETYDKLVELAENEDENSFVRQYSAEAIGEMGKDEAVPVLVNLFESEDPNLRASAIKALSNFSDSESKNTIIQGVKDSHLKVRNAAIDAVKKLKITSADEYLIYRAKNDKEPSVKKSCYAALASLGTGKGDDYLLGELENKKTGDNTKLEIATALLGENEKGAKQIASLAVETVKDDRRKQLRYALGKLMAKYDNSAFSDVCLLYIQNKDVSTIGTGLDIYAKGRYSNCDSAVRELAEKADLNAKSKNQMAIKAAKILGMDVEKMTEKKDAEREAEETAKKALDSAKKNGTSKSASSNSAENKDAK